jgi:predicted DNA-binding transcriptional regulator AlpA
MPGLQKKLGDPSKSKVYNDVRDKLLPEPVKDGPMSTWPEDEIDKIIDLKVAGGTKKEIRALVKSLVAARANRAPGLAA